MINNSITNNSKRYIIKEHISCYVIFIYKIEITCAFYIGKVRINALIYRIMSI